MRYSVGIQFTLKLNSGNTPLPVATSTITGNLFLANDYTLHFEPPVYLPTLTVFCLIFEFQQD
jgi:hypothetical protein